MKLTHTLDSHRNTTKQEWRDSPEPWEAAKPQALPHRYIQNQKEVTEEASADMKEYAKWSPLPKNSDDMMKSLREEGFCSGPCPKPAKHRQRSASRQRTPSRGRTSAATEVVLTGLPEELHLDTISKEDDPPQEEKQELVLEPAYHDVPAAPNNFTNQETLACAAHRLRAHHGIYNPPNILCYKGARSEYEHAASQQEDDMTDDIQQKKLKLFELYDQLAEDSGLLVPRPDLEDAEFYLAGKIAELDLVKDQLLKQEKAGWPDIKAYGETKAKRDKLLKIVNYMICFGTAKAGYIDAKATPRNAGKIIIRCSNPRGTYYGQIPVEIAQSRVACSCGWPFYICQRFMTIMPPEGSQMDVELVNLRIKKGYGIKK